MRFEELLLGLGFVEEVMSRPVTRGQSMKSFLHVVMLFETIDHLPQLILSTFDWSKPKIICNMLHIHQSQVSVTQVL